MITAPYVPRTRWCERTVSSISPCHHLENRHIDDPVHDLVRGALQEINIGTPSLHAAYQCRRLVPICVAEFTVPYAPRTLWCDCIFSFINPCCELEARRRSTSRCAPRYGSEEQLRKLLHHPLHASVDDWFHFVAAITNRSVRSTYTGVSELSAPSPTAMTCRTGTSTIRFTMPSELETLLHDDVEDVLDHMLRKSLDGWLHSGTQASASSIILNQSAILRSKNKDTPTSRNNTVMLFLKIDRCNMNGTCSC